MLSGTQLSFAISSVLLFCVLIGWVMHWIWCRMGMAATTTEAQMQELVDRLHAADQAREEAEEARIRAESRLSSREAELENRMAAMQARLDGAIEGREAELAAELREAKADLEAMSEGLRNARWRIAELEADVREQS